MPVTPWQFIVHEELPSTQDEAGAAARGGADRVAILARRQTAGRGRAGRPWQAPVGNLNLSLILRPGPQPLVPAAWSLLAGLALFDAIAPCLPPGQRLALKWPNDLLLNGAKCAGILIDSALTPQGLIDWLVIGIGVNLQTAPALPDRPTASLAQAGVQLTAEQAAEAILAQLDHWLPHPLATIRAAWLARAHPPGTALRVQTTNGLIEGAFAGLGEDGALLLETGQRITSGDVFLG